MATENTPRPEDKKPQSEQGADAGQKPGQEKKPESEMKSDDRNKPTGQTKR